MTPGRRAMLLMTVFAALWAIIELVVVFFSRSYSLYQVVWLRYGVHLAFMVAVWGWRDPNSLWRTRRPVYQLGRSLLMLGMPASFIIAQQRGVDPGVVSAIFWTCPLMMLAIARLYLGERAPWPVWFVAATAVASVGFAASPGTLPAPSLLLLPVAMAGTFSLYVVMTRSLRTERTRANLFYSALGVFLPLSLMMPKVWITPSPRDLLVNAGIGLIGFLGLFVMDRLAAAAPVSASAPFTTLQLVFSSGLAGMLGYQHPGRRMALGGSVIAASLFYLWMREPVFAVRGDAR